jgi:1,4-dihydroxy-2-naphthoate octaprenyltransferase
MRILPKDLLHLGRISRPTFLLSGAMLYGLGAAIASFLGKPLTASRYLLGQGLVTFLQLTAVLLEAYHEAQIQDIGGNDSKDAPDDLLIPGERSQRLALYTAIVCIVLAGTLASVTLAHGGIPIVSWLILALCLLGALFYGAPPLYLKTSGYGEVTASLLLTMFVPALGFSLQTGTLHRLLPMTTTPLLALHFALMIALQVPDYASDMKYNRRRLMVRLGWASAMWLHDIAIALAVVSIAIAFLFGLPPRVAAGALIALPLAFAQIWQMDRLRRGFPARWRPLTVGAMGLFGLMTYLELIGYMLS